MGFVLSHFLTYFSLEEQAGAGKLDSEANVQQPAVTTFSLNQVKSLLTSHREILEHEQDSPYGFKRKERDSFIKKKQRLSSGHLQFTLGHTSKS